MTVTREIDVPATLTVEHDCERRCQSEYDLDGLHIRQTLGQMLTAIDRAHKEAHAAALPARVYAGYAGILVRAAELAVTR